ncbi:MAG: thermonuclease family protein [Candidatus Caenarcaniphilales bacterium]|nr:thermonuclease family protein [Candidatus Caenarcaniphilales bacterium]
MPEGFTLTPKRKNKLVLVFILLVLFILQTLHPQLFERVFSFVFEKTNTYDFCYPKKLVTVTDGDTIKFLANTAKKKYLKVRLIGIDAPEMRQTPFGIQSKDFLEGLINDSLEDKVCCKRGKEPKDKYGRTLADCWVGKTFLNASLIENGQAVSYFIGNKNNKYKNLFFKLEEQAEIMKVGFHNPDNLLTELPYEWRKRERSQFN